MYTYVGRLVFGEHDRRWSFFIRDLEEENTRSSRLSLILLRSRLTKEFRREAREACSPFPSRRAGEEAEPPRREAGEIFSLSPGEPPLCTARRAQIVAQTVVLRGLLAGPSRQRDGEGGWRRLAALREILEPVVVRLRDDDGDARIPRRRRRRRRRVETVRGRNPRLPPREFS